MDRQQPQGEADSINQDPDHGDAQDRAAEDRAEGHAATNHDTEQSRDRDQGEEAADPGNVRVQKKHARRHRRQA